MSVKELTLRREDRCAECGADLAAGARARWDVDSRAVTCLTCPAELGECRSAPERLRGGGASAQREYDRRHDAREQSVRARHPRIGGLLLAIIGDPPSTAVWAQGAAGERAVAEVLDQLEMAVSLHDRRMRGPDGRLTRANIDHITIAPSGVWVIDAKTHRGRLEVQRSGGLFAPRSERLLIGGRDRTTLIDGLQAQVEAVRRELESSFPAAPVLGALCFVGTELPWIDENIAGFPLRGRKGLLKLLRQSGPIDGAVRTALTAELDERFPPA